MTNITIVKSKRLHITLHCKRSHHISKEKVPKYEEMTPRSTSLKNYLKESTKPYKQK